jgi:hypothetical protein
VGACRVSVAWGLPFSRTDEALVNTTTPARRKISQHEDRSESLSDMSRFPADAKKGHSWRGGRYVSSTSARHGAAAVTGEIGARQLCFASFGRLHGICLIRFTDEQLNAKYHTAYPMLLSRQVLIIPAASWALDLHHHMRRTRQDMDRLSQKHQSLQMDRSRVEHIIDADRKRKLRRRKQGAKRSLSVCSSGFLCVWLILTSLLKLIKWLLVLR